MGVMVGSHVLYLRNEKSDYLLNVMHCLVFVCDVTTAALMMLMFVGGYFAYRNHTNRID